MDTELLKTFLEVHRTRHFGRAAENLHLTQSAVSARVRLLEQQLGVELFSRDRNNIRLTPGGERLLRHAQGILGAWERARQDVSLGSQRRQQLTVAAMPSLWDTLLQTWLGRLWEESPGIGLRIESLPSEQIAARLRQNLIDIGFLYEPPQLPELTLREVAMLPLLMVASRPGLTVADALSERYLMVDWGTGFSTAHARHFPECPPAGAHVSSARIAFNLLSQRGGAAYLAEPMVERELAEGRLFEVTEAPVLPMIIYAAYPTAIGHGALIEQVLGML